MANPEHLAIFKQGISTWNYWRKHHPDVRPDLNEARLENTNLNGVDLRGATLNGAKLNGAALNGATLVKADLSRADLSRAALNGATLVKADLSRADLSRANLIGVNLSEANLIGVNLSEAKLSRATLNGAYLNGAKLNGAKFNGAKLNGAFLIEADLSEADLSEADLSEAYLRRANLGNANLGNANLSEVYLVEAVFADNDLRAVKGLVEIHHGGPSIVQLHTVKLPQDGSALHFLRGTGVPNEWIDFYRVSMMMPIQYYSCFISYTHQDEKLARRLHADLQDHGVRCWFAPEDMKIGDKIRARIDEAIHLHEKLLLLLSEYALASVWVEDEVEAAMEKEQRQQREVLFPVRLDASVMQTSQAWAAQLRRTRHIGDFTYWTDPQAYQIAFDRLLRDLKKADREEIEDGGS